MHSFNTKKRVLSFVLALSMLLQFVLPLNHLSFANSTEEAKENGEWVESLEERPKEAEIKKESIEEPVINESKDQVINSEELETDEMPSGDDTAIVVQEATGFEYVVVDGGVKITGWTGNTTDVVIPDVIDGLPVVAIGRGENSFQRRGITSLSIGKNVRIIDPYTFADNKISNLIIPVDSELISIGDYAFVDNQLTSLVLPIKLEEIGENAFTNNRLNNVQFNDAIRTIGNRAFSKNNLTRVKIGNSVTSFGENVFIENGRYVIVDTDNFNIPKLDKNGQLYGHVVGAISIIVKYINKSTGDEIRSSKIIGTDMTDQNNIFIIGEESVYEPEKISGYDIFSPIIFTPDKDKFELVLNYQPTTIPPVIELVGTPEIPEGISAEEVDNILKNLVKATDVLGRDISGDIVVQKGDLSSEVAGQYDVSFTVTDQYGNTTTEIFAVVVGNDWMKYPIGGGWVLGDFTYNNNFLTGLSEQGKAKLAALPAGSKDLILPGFSPIGTRPAIEFIGMSAFGSVAADSIDFINLTNLREIREKAFLSAKFSELRNLNKLGNLQKIGSDVFRTTNIKNLSFDGLTKLVEIGSTAFFESKIESIDFTGADSLQIIGSSTFAKNKLTSLNFEGAPNIRIIGMYAFESMKTLKTVDFSGLTKLEELRTGAFQYSGLTSVDLTPIPQLTIIKEYTFMYNPITSIDFSNSANIKTIERQAFYRTNNLKELDLSPLVNLERINTNAFSHAGIEEIKFGADNKLLQIGQYSFANNNIKNLDLSLLTSLENIIASAFASNLLLETITFPKKQGDTEPKLKQIGEKAFENSNSLVSLDISNLPYLTSIGTESFKANNTIQNQSLTTLNMENLPSLKTIGPEAFKWRILSDVYITNVPNLLSISHDAFKENTGNPEYDNLVVIWYEPKEETKIVSKSNYIVNPDDSTGEFLSTDFTYETIAGKRTITGFTSVGASKLVNGDHKLIIPELDPNGEPIKAIGKAAFSNRKILELDLRNMKSLELIDEEAFFNNEISKVSFPLNSKINQINYNAFYNNKITSVDFSRLRELQTLGGYVFGKNLVENVDLSPLTKLSSTGDGLFSENPIKDVHLGNLPLLETIGSSAFSSTNNGDSTSPLLDLSGLPSLKRIANSAFIGIGIQSINLSGLENLASIGDNAFSNNKLESLDFTGLNSLATIGGSAFRNNSTLKHVNFASIPNLKIIGHSAFENGAIEDVNFGNLPKIEYISVRTFAYNNIQSLDLSGLTGLKTINSQGFAYNNISDIDFGDIPLKEIFINAFSNNNLTELDLSNLPTLVTIQSGAFNNNKLSEVYISDNIITLQAAFKYNTPEGFDSYQLVVVNTESGNNPHKLANDTSQTNLGGHIVDPRRVVVSYVDEEGNELSPQRTEFDIRVDATTRSVKALDIPGYSPIHKTVTIEYLPGQNIYEATFVYEKQDYTQLPTLNMRLDHENTGKNIAHVGDLMFTHVDISASSGIDDLINPQLKVFFDSRYVDLKKLKIPALPGVYTVEIGDGVINFNFTKIQGADYYSIPIQWAFKRDVTPQNYEMELTTELRDSDGKVILVPFDDNNNPTFPSLISYHNIPSLDKEAPSSVYGGHGGLRVAGNSDYTVIEGEDVEYISETVAVPFRFDIRDKSTTPISSKIERNLSEVKLVDTLPTYKAVENGKIVEKTAQFIPEENLLWELDESTGTVSYTKSINNSNNMSGLIPYLYLRFPGALVEQDIYNKAQVNLVPYDRPDYEEDMVLNADVTINPVPSPEPITIPGIVQKRFNKTVAPSRFEDLMKDKTKDFKWYLSFTPNSEDMIKGNYFKNIVLNDNNLDERFYYESININNEDIIAVIRSYDTNDNLISENETVNGKYTFTNPENIRRVEIDYGDNIISTKILVSISTKLRDPENVHFDPVVSSNNSFTNCAVATSDMYDSTDKHVEQGKLTSCAVTRIQRLDLDIIPLKTQTYTNASWVTMGESGDYDLFVSRRLRGLPVSDSDLKLPVNNFKMIDLLPKGMLLDEKGVQLTPEFSQSPGANYEIVHDFKDGRTAIIFTADILEGNVQKVATLHTTTDLLMDLGLNTNELYLSFDQDTTEIKYGKPVDPIDFGDGNEYMKVEVSFALLKADYMQARKYIRNLDENLEATSEWSPTGVVTEGSGYLQYMLLIDNNTQHSKTGNEIYDVLPYRNDRTIQLNSNGLRSYRGSAFSNKLINIEVQGKYAEDYKIEYTSDRILYSPANVEASEYLKTKNWYDTMPSNTTAFRVVPIDPSLGRIDPKDNLKVIVTMQAPNVIDDLYGLRAVNSFIRTDASLFGRYLEANMVYNSIPYPKGSLVIRKISEATDENNNIIPLEGAEFSLLSTSGTILAKAVTGADGIARFDNIPIDDYEIVESKNPEGYTGTVTKDVSKTTWFNDKYKPDYIYNLGDVKNTPQYKATLIIEKKGANDLPLQGVRFRLVPIHGQYLENRYYTTDENGRIVVENLQKGQYQLFEERSLGILKIIPRINITITKPDEVYRLTDENAVINDTADVRINKIGLLDKLDMSKTLANYSSGSGLALREAWKFEVYNVNNPNDKKEITTGTMGVATIPNLKAGELYAIKEISGPANTIYKTNNVEYKFMVNPRGQLVDENGQSFMFSEIYFPNEKKDMLGEVKIVKTDQYNDLVANAEFTLFRFNDVTKEYESTGISLNTDDSGIALFENIPSGSYEIRETRVPDGYASTVKPIRFVVESTPTNAMTAPIYDNSRDDAVVHKFNFDVKNFKLNLEFIKQLPIADNISEAEANELVASNPEYIKRQSGQFYSVYLPISGVKIDMYEVRTGADILIAEDVVTDAEGKLDITNIPGFYLKPDAIYKFVETQTKDNTWILNQEPIIVNMRDQLSLSGFNGTVNVSMNNFKKTGDILISKYDRYNNNRLAGVTFTLYKGSKSEVIDANGEYLESRKVKDSVTDLNGFIHFTNLELGEYVIVETATLEDQGYFLFEEPLEFNITPEETHFFKSVYNMQGKDYFNLPVEKIWKGEIIDNPEGVVLVLKQNGVELERKSLTAANDWKLVFENLLKRDNQNAFYNYTIEELVPNDYRSVVIGKAGNDGIITDDNGNILDHITVKNYKLMDLRVEKVWDDFNNKYGLRPESLEVQLKRNGENIGNPVIITSDEHGAWSYTFTNLQTHDEDNIEYKYTVEEKPTIGYNTEYSEDGLTITNKLQAVDIEANKNWVDQENKYGIRPETITLQLMRNNEEFGDPVIVRENSNKEWKYLFTDLPELDANGTKYKYEVKELEVPGYSTSISEDGLTITNTLIEKDIVINKIWEDYDNHYGTRPVKISVQLLQNGNPLLDKVELSSDNNWEYRFEGLPETDNLGNPFKYTIVEDKINGYEDSYTDSEDNLSVTNTLIETSVTAKKIWEDFDNKYGIRPDSVSIQLLQDGNPLGEKVLLNDANFWNHDFENLPKTAPDGHDYLYTIVEDQVNAYETSYSEDKLTVTNTLIETSVETVKIWDDFDNKYGLRPENITLQLLQNGESLGEPVVVEADAEGNWTYTFDELPMYDKNGKEFIYTVKEIDVNGYETSYSEDGLTVTNELLKTSVKSEKIWQDQENKYNTRPENITLQLLQNGNSLGEPVNVTEDMNWEYIFEDLPKTSSDGTDYVYTVEEDSVNGYETSYSDDKLTVTNTLIETSVEAVKTWEDFNNKYELRPETITLQLLQNGEALGEPVIVKADEEGNWTYTFTELPKIDLNGEDFIYTVEELDVNGYEKIYSEDGLSITNKLIVKDIEISKVWEDDNNRENLRPSEIVVQLFRDGEKFLDPIILSADDEGNWRYQFKDLPIYNIDGKVFEYRVEENKLDNYEVSYSEDGLTITNKLIPIDKPIKSEKPIDPEKPESPRVPNPKTGDTSNNMQLIILIAISAVGIYAISRKKKEY